MEENYSPASLLCKVGTCKAKRFNLIAEAFLWGLKIEMYKDFDPLSFQ